MLEYKRILEAKRRMEFNMTEPEVLRRLIEVAKKKGDGLQQDLQRLSRQVGEILEACRNNALLLTRSDLERVSVRYNRCVGIDGSFQLRGGAGGRWHVFYSVARVVFENGLGGQPEIEFWADIEDISEQEEFKPEIAATLLMLTAETKAIFNWGVNNKPAYVMIDGPIVDPPFFIKDSHDYLEYRCEAIKKILQHSVIIGCVKRPRDNFYVRYLFNILHDQNLKKKLEVFQTDQYLMAMIFAKMRREGYTYPFFTKPIDVSEINNLYKTYKEKGIHIITLFFQKNPSTPVLRLDIPLLNKVESELNFYTNILHIVKVIDMWIYPGQDYPLPVYLAHEKSNIREGCADILYFEIMTRGYATDPDNQLVLHQLR
jgi:hypothetical protein